MIPAGDWVSLSPRYLGGAPASEFVGRAITGHGGGVVEWRCSGGGARRF